MRSRPERVAYTKERVDIAAQRYKEAQDMVNELPSEIVFSADPYSGPGIDIAWKGLKLHARQGLYVLALTRLAIHETSGPDQG